MNLFNIIPQSKSNITFQTLILY